MKILSWALALALTFAVAVAPVAGFAQSGQGSSPVTIPKGGTNASTASQARTNLGLAIGSNVQAWDADLDALAGLSGTGIYYRSASNTWSLVTIGGLLSFSGGTLNVGDAELTAIAALTSSADKCIYYTGSGSAATFDCLSWARSVISAANASAGRTAFGLAIGTDVQAYDVELAALAGLTSANNKCFYWTGAGTASTFDCSSYGRGLINAADASAARTTLGSVIGTDVQAYNARLAGIAGLAATANRLFGSDGSGNASLITLPAAGLTLSAGAIALANDLSAIEALSGTGIARRTGTDSWSVGTLVTNAELANMATATFKGRTTAGSGAPEDLSGTQATALLINCVGDGGSGGTKGLVPAPGAGDAAAGKFLKADCTFAVPSGGGGGSGATDTERQNSLLGLIYQSKTFAGARRLVNLFADGFKASDGVNAGSSSSYAVTTASGYVAATVASLSYTNSATVSGTLSFGPNYTYVNRQTAITNGVTVCYLGISLASAETVTLKIIQRDSSTQNDIVFSQSFAHPGGGYADMTMSSCYTVPGSGTYYPAVWFNSSASRTATVSGGRSYYNGDPAVQNNLTGWTDDTAQGPALRWAPAGVPDNMTLVTASQTADSSVSNGRVLLEYDNSASPTLNTDLTVEVTTNGGTNWAAATLSAVTSYSQAGRKVAETADTATTSGTSFAARIKTFNNKDIKVYGATLTVR